MIQNQLKTNYLKFFFINKLTNFIETHMVLKHTLKKINLRKFEYVFEQNKMIKTNYYKINLAD